MQKIIEVVNLSKNFGGHLVLDNLGFAVDDGALVGLIGKSGCGKTTLLNTIVGYLKPNRGSVFYRGRNTQKAKLEFRRNIGFAVQDGSFYKNLTVTENLEYFGRLYGLSKRDIKERIQILLSSFELTEAHHVLAGNLSVGMQKRLDIACALIHDPELLLLDEPTANLDPMLRSSILELIRKINDSGTTVIISSHALEDINALCDKVLMVNNKKIVSFDSPRSLNGFSDQKTIKIETEMKDYTDLINFLTKKELIKGYKSKDGALMLSPIDVKTALKHINYYYAHSYDNILCVELVKTPFEELFERQNGV